MFTFGSAVLQSEGRVNPAPQEGRSTPNMIEELDSLFPGDPSNISFSNLKDLATKVYIRYMSLRAHQDALGNVPRCTDIYGKDGDPWTPQDDGGEAFGWNGDRQMANLTLQMRDCLWYYEFCHAVVDGDIGRVMEIIKVTAVTDGANPPLTWALASSVLILGCWSFKLWKGADSACSLAHPHLYRRRAKGHPQQLACEPIREAWWVA